MHNWRVEFGVERGSQLLLAVVEEDIVIWLDCSVVDQNEEECKEVVGSKTVQRGSKLDTKKR